MKHTIILFTAISIALLLSSGCTSSNDTDLPSPETTISTAETASNTEKATDNAAEDTSGTLEAASNTAEATSSREESAAALGLEVFKGLPKAENTMNTINSKPYRPSLLCYGGGNTFFMWNGTVYKHNDDTTEPLFEKNAYNLNYNDGKLYFIENDDFDVNSRDHVIIEGFLYRYDLETGELKQLTDYHIAQLIVTDEGIFYTDYATPDDPEPLSGIYRIDEKTGQSERYCDSMYYVEYSGYRLKYTKDSKGNTVSVFFKDNEEYFSKDFEASWVCINGDYCYFRKNSDDFLNRVSMLTGEVTSLKPYESISEYVTDKSSTVCADYTVLNDVIYFLDDMFFLRRYDEETDSCIPIECERSLKYIYSDEKNIYGADFQNNFVKITLNGDKAEMEILA